MQIPDREEVKAQTVQSLEPRLSAARETLVEPHVFKDEAGIERPCHGGMPEGVEIGQDFIGSTQIVGVCPGVCHDKVVFMRSGGNWETDQNYVQLIVEHPDQ